MENEKKQTGGLTTPPLEEMNKFYEGQAKPTRLSGSNEQMKRSDKTGEQQKGWLDLSPEQEKMRRESLDKQINEQIKRSDKWIEAQEKSKAAQKKWLDDLGKKI